MTITQLKYALAIAEHKNFTKAAEKCFVTQPTLSTQIQKLEDELDIVIFDRGKKPIELTEVGRKIVFQARNIVKSIISTSDCYFYREITIRGSRCSPGPAVGCGFVLDRNRSAFCLAR